MAKLMEFQTIGQVNYMKSLSILFLSLIIVNSAIGQVSDAAKSSNPYKIGVHLSSRFSSFSNDSKSEEHGFTFSGTPDIGVSVYIPAHKKNLVGFTADFTLANYQNTYTVTAGNDKTDFTRTFNYLMIVPGINFENVTFGIGVGLPMGYHRHNNTKDEAQEESWTFLQGGTANPITVTGDGKGGMNMIIEPRLGYSQPFRIADGSQLNVNANVGLMLSNVFKEDYYPTSNLQSLNGSMLSVSLGIQYMFAL